MNKEILRLAIPNILSNISVPLLSSVDTALMGYIGNAAHIGAIGLGAMLFNFIYWAFSFLRMGTTGMTAQAFGRKDNEEVIAIFGRGLIVSTSVAMFMIVFQELIAYWCMPLLGADGITIPLIYEYYNIRIWGAPAALGLMVFMGVFFGLQNAIYPLILTFIINISNIIISYILVYQYGMGIQGVAYGTLIAQYIGLVAAIIFFLYEYKHYFNFWKKQIVFQVEKLIAFASVNRDIFIRTVCLIIAFGFFYNRSAFMGVTILAVNQVFMQYINWMSYSIDGFAFASESLVGKYEGANQSELKSKTIIYCFVWGAVLAVLYSIFFWIGDEYLLRIFTNDESVITEGQHYMIWIIIYPILGFASYIWDGVFVGLTAGKAMRDTMFLSLVAFIASYYLLDYFDNHGLWAALCVYVVARGILQTIWYRWIIK